MFTNLVVLYQKDTKEARGAKEQKLVSLNFSRFVTVLQVETCTIADT